MPSLIVSMEDELKERMERISWVNWSEIAREEVFKREIFERYLETGKLSGEEQRFCDKLDWHPADWLPLKKSFIKDLKEAGKHSEPMNAREFKVWCDRL